MKTVRNLLVIASLLLTTHLFAQKRYDVKSGIVTYKIEGGGSMLGVSTKTTGTQKLYFKDYGNVEVRIIDETSNTMGQVSKTHAISKLDHGTAYSVDEESKRIIKQDIALLRQQDKKQADMLTMGKDMMEKMGGKKIGTGKVLGYPCEIWTILGSKVWMYKGVPLKTEADIMGFKHTEVATSAKFNVHVPEKYFQLPNYPVTTMDAMIQEAMQKAEREEEMEKAQKQQPHTQPTTPPAQPQISPEQMKQMQDMLQNLGKMFGQQ